MTGNYAQFYRRSIESRDAFWSEQAQLIDWHKPFESVVDFSRPPFARWFVGGETNLFVARKLVADIIVIGSDEDQPMIRDTEIEECPRHRADARLIEEAVEITERPGQNRHAVGVGPLLHH